MRKLTIFTFVIVTLALISCENKEEPTFIYTNEYVGFWKANETKGINAPMTYTVEIKETDDLNTLDIYGLHNVPNIITRAKVEGIYLTIPRQKVADTITIEGSGKASSAYDQINLDFIMTAGVVTDSITAILIP